MDWRSVLLVIISEVISKVFENLSFWIGDFCANVISGIKSLYPIILTRINFEVILKK